MQRTTLGYVGSLLVFCDILLVLTGYEIPRGCMVERTILVEPIEFDSVDFHVHISHSGSNGSLGKLFEARLECKDNSYLNYDFITVTEENVLLEFNRGEMKTPFPSGVPRFQEGWTTFSLGFVKHYSLQGTGGHLWWAHNESSSTDCHVVKVEVNGSLLMRYCPSQEVSWRVSGRKGIDVPLFLNSGNGNIEHLILYSSEDFYPKMKLDEWEFWIGMDADAMAIKKEREDRPLPSFTEHHLVLLFRESKNNSTEIMIMSEDKELSSQAVKRKPRHLKVLKGGNGSYFLTQRRSIPDNEAEIIPSHPANPSDTIWILSGVLGLCCVVITVQLTWQLRLYWTFKRKISTTEGTVSRRRLNAEDHLNHVQISAPWGHPTLPLPASPPPPTPLSFRGPSRPPLPRGRVVLQERQRSPEEHAYYEMLTFGAGILAKANVADVEDSAETVNDIYENASE